MRHENKVTRRFVIGEKEPTERKSEWKLFREDPIDFVKSMGVIVASGLFWTTLLIVPIVICMAMVYQATR